MTFVPTQKVYFTYRLTTKSRLPSDFEHGLYISFDLSPEEKEDLKMLCARYLVVLVLLGFGLGDGCVVALVLTSVVLGSGVAKHLAATFSGDPVPLQT